MIAKAATAAWLCLGLAAPAHAQNPLRSPQNEPAPPTERATETSTQNPLAALRQYIEGFNKGDVKVMAAIFTDRAAILDGMAPHLWLGPTAAQDWYRDVLAEGEQHGASDYFVTLGDPLHNDITGDAAYVVVPATMTFKVNGKQVTQTGAIFTVALRKLADGWRIAAWAWAKGTQLR